MGHPQSYDVIVVGGGPGGSVAAKRCAENGLNTLLLERKSLPRDKVCSGMVMGAWAEQIIREEFGEIPAGVLVDPPRLVGHKIHVAERKPQTLRWQTPLTWRKDLDSWMVQRAGDSGAIIQDRTRALRVGTERDGCRVAVGQRGEEKHLFARYVIGADGSASIVRRSILPDLKVRYSAPIRECYRGELGLEREYIHWFFPKAAPRPRFNINHKDDVFLIEGSGIRELRKEVIETLARFGGNPSATPSWKDACPMAQLHDKMLSQEFVPASQNILLVGDAAGLILPITFEGIGSALKSGLLAADAIIESSKSGKPPASSFLKSIEGIVETIASLCAVQDDLKKASGQGPDRLGEAIVNAYRETHLKQEE